VGTALNGSETGVRGCAVTKEEFERLTAEVLDSLPQAMGLDNVEVTLEDQYPPGVSQALALYRGVPLPARHANAAGYNLSAPDKIELYWRVFLAQYGPDLGVLRGEIRRVLIHEIAHHHGISDARLREIGAY
jgi:predicted Zn-dependent protease with MMP-like domain